MVGGAIIEVLEMVVRFGCPKAPRRVNRLWCVDKRTHEEICVFAEWYPPGSGPKVGESIWWQAGRIFYDGDRKSVNKLGVTYTPKGAEP